MTQNNVIGVDIANGEETTVYGHLEGDKLIIDKIERRPVEEKKTLSDNFVLIPAAMVGIRHPGEEAVYREYDVKHYLKKFIEFTEEMTLGGWNKTVRDKAKSIFGERVIE